ncbi:MAG TPA: FHA domain-containing protein, partial [Waterburya sp.]
MSQSISTLVDNLPARGMTVYMLRALDFIVPGEWQNLVGFDNTIREVTGVTDKDLIEEIGARAIALYKDHFEVYQQTLWLYQTVDRADSAIGAAALANKIGEKISFLGFLNQLTPKADTVQTIDLCLKLAVEVIAFSRLHGIPTSIDAFRTSLSNYHNESVMRMAALIAVDGLIPLGPNFILKTQSILSQLQPSQLESNATYQSISSAIPGGSTSGKLSFIGQNFASIQGWMNNFVASRGLTQQQVVSHLQQFMNVADSKLDYLAAFLDLSTNYYEHTGTQTVARNLILRAAQETKGKG